MVTVTGVTKHYNRNKVINNISLNILPQDILGLVGPDGAGKTTLIRIICGLVDPDEGKVTLLDTPTKNIEKVKDRIGYMPQRFSLYPDLTVMENITFLAALYNIEKGLMLDRCGEILNKTGLDPFRNRLAGNLSGGMKQKLALSCALITQPELLILDEPTYGVDPLSRKEFWDILYQINQEGITLLVSTPYMDEAELCKRVALINQGNLIALASPNQLKKRINHPIIEIKTNCKDPELFDNFSPQVISTFYGDKYHLEIINKEFNLELITKYLKTQNLISFSMKKINPSMEDVFVNLLRYEVTKCSQQSSPEI